MEEGQKRKRVVVIELGGMPFVVVCPLMWGLDDEDMERKEKMWRAKLQ